MTAPSKRGLLAAGIATAVAAPLFVAPSGPSAPAPRAPAAQGATSGLNGHAATNAAQVSAVALTMLGASAAGARRKAKSPVVCQASETFQQQAMEYPAAFEEIAEVNNKEKKAETWQLNNLKLILLFFCEKEATASRLPLGFDAAGMNVIRCNMSHGDHEEQSMKLANLEKAYELAPEFKGKMKILMDTRGPEIRTGTFEVYNSKKELKAGQDFKLVTDYEQKGDENMVAITYSQLPKSVKKGQRILVQDGTVILIVEECGEDYVMCKVVNDCKLGEKKNVNVPGVKVEIPVVGEREIKDIEEWAVPNNADYIALSFVQSADDVKECRKHCKGKDIKVISKIENVEGLKNFEDHLGSQGKCTWLKSGWFSMLLVELGSPNFHASKAKSSHKVSEKVWMAQKMMLKKTKAAGKYAVCATEMLASMEDRPFPTRAEACDVANAILDGAEAVMLSSESAMGKFPVETVNTMRRIVEEAEHALVSELAFVKVETVSVKEDLQKRFRERLKRMAPDTAVLDPHLLKKSLDSLVNEIKKDFEMKLKPWRMPEDDEAQVVGDFHQALLQAVQHRTIINDQQWIAKMELGAAGYAAAGAAAAGGVGVGLFGYNRGNYMMDQKLHWARFNAGFNMACGGGQWPGQGYRSQWSGQSSGQNAAHNPYVIQMPKFLEPIGETEDVEDQSIIVVDTRDDRMVSPFQTWLVSEIMSNAASSINVLTECDQVMPPNSGYHIALFANYTLDGIKAVLAISIESETGNTCAQWDADAAHALSHQAFQPFSWPMLRDTSASYTDIKVYNGNEILFHWVLRGFRSDTDLTVQTQFVDEFFVREVNKGKPRLSVVVAVFVGWRVSVMSFECGGRTYALAPGGAVVAGDSARSRFELRVCSRSSNDAVGNDADRLEFRYRDANNRIDLKCSGTSVPGTWLTVSHISGPTLIRTINSVRENRARVEGPEQTEQFAQLAAVHEGWWKKSIAQDPASVGSLVVFVEGLEEGNFHVQARSKLFVRVPEVVNTSSLAEMNHVESRPAPIGPPSLTSEAWLSSRDSVQVGVEDQMGGSVVEVRRQTGLELNQRAFSDRTISLLSGHGAGGHVEDADRDRARDDRRFARSTAGLTPAIFAEEMQRRICNATTAVIEEVDTIDSAEPPSHAHGRSGRGAEAQSSAAAQGPVTYSPPQPE
eukprot:s92_g33.t1